MVTTNEPNEIMTTTLVKIPNDWDGGACHTRLALASDDVYVPTFTLSKIPSKRQSTNVPHRSQSLVDSIKDKE